MPRGKKSKGLHVTLAGIGYADVGHVTVTMGGTTLMICAEEHGKGVKVYETTGKFLYVLPIATNAVVLKGAR